jgi:hypothetical protein
MDKTLCWSVLSLLIFAMGADAQQDWQIHEWGTFTSLQDESGRAIGGINTDDEPVPDFVHSFFPILPAADIVPRQFNKGLPSCHPDVTMRLETPVIYFHPPPGTANGQSASVNVHFRGGWLTQFYPNAVADAPGLTNGFHLDSDTVGTLKWDHLQIGGDWPLTNTTEHVWIAPRQVRAANVRSSDGEGERFLFYRGVGHMDAPLRISRDPDSGELLIQSQLENLPSHRPLNISALWLVDIHSDGEIAFRTLPSLTLDGDSNRILQRTSGIFEAKDYQRANLEKLETSLKASLMAEGLFGDEAQALLSTWQVSYFKSPGMRVFFLCPRDWTDYYLPLHISLPAQINRVMVGRIELITPADRHKLQQLAALSPTSVRDQSIRFMQTGIQRYQDLRPVFAGKKAFTDVVPFPESYQTYLELGRFRNALLLDEEKERPTAGLAEFIDAYGLQGYQVAETRSGETLNR